MPQFNMNFTFLKHQDLTYKANPFIQIINDMRDLDIQIFTLINQETSEQTGEIIEAINEDIQKHTTNNANVNNHFEEQMHLKAKQYDMHIFDISSQLITVYYDIIEINKPK